jgi:hypothetical protein
MNSKEFNAKFKTFCEDITEHDSSFISIRAVVTQKVGT